MGKLQRRAVTDVPRGEPKRQAGGGAGSQDVVDAGQHDSGAGGQHFRQVLQVPRGDLPVRRSFVRPGDADAPEDLPENPAVRAAIEADAIDDAFDAIDISEGGCHGPAAGTAGLDECQVDVEEDEGDHASIVPQVRAAGDPDVPRRYNRSMRILAIDMGTGTQDIVVFDTEKPVENNVKLVLPSATEIAARRIRRAGAEGVPIVLSGVVAGGGPCHWALEEFVRSGGSAFATPEAAQTFDDDLDRVAEMGVRVIAEDEVRGTAGAHIELRDLDLDAIRTALRAFEEPVEFDGLALGCLDHGAAPPGVSDRVFRFDHLRRTVKARNDLLSFALRPEDLPPYLTRALSMVGAARGEGDIAFMDTGPAAALGALHDERVAAAGEAVVLNAGNMHLLAFHLRGRIVASLYEHHTGEVTVDQIERFTQRLAEGELTNEEIFSSKGHGAFHPARGLVGAGLPGMVAVTGPQRYRLRGSALDPYFAAPFGDMMVSGCFGLVRGFAEVYPGARDEITVRLGWVGALRA
jgi:uncharacterized protein (DUF1786 family)